MKEEILLYHATKTGKGYGNLKSMWQGLTSHTRAMEVYRGGQSGGFFAYKNLSDAMHHADNEVAETITNKAEQGSPVIVSTRAKLDSQWRPDYEIHAPDIKSALAEHRDKLREIIGRQIKIGRKEYVKDISERGIRVGETPTGPGGGFLGFKTLHSGDIGDAERLQGICDLLQENDPQWFDRWNQQLMEKLVEKPGCVAFKYIGDEALKPEQFTIKQAGQWHNLDPHFLTRFMTKERPHKIKHDSGNPDQMARS